MQERIVFFSGFLFDRGGYLAVPNRGQMPECSGTEKDDAAAMLLKDWKKSVFRLRGLDFKPFRVYIILILFF